MKEFITFCNSIKKLVESYPQMDIEGARKVISAINEYLYTTHEQIGRIENFGITFNYFSDIYLQMVMPSNQYGIHVVSQMNKFVELDS